MHAIDLADLACTFVRHMPAQIALRCAPSEKAAKDLWLACRYRQQDWMQRLTRHRDAIQSPGTSFRSQSWLEILPLFHEVLTSEILSRVIAYHSVLLEQLDIDRELAPLAHSTLAGHAEARCRCLHLMVFGAGLSVENAVKLNRLRRSLETLTDELLSLMPPVENLRNYGFEPERIRRNQNRINPPDRQSEAMTLVIAGVSETLWKTTAAQVDWRVANARLNYQIAQCVLRCWPAESFEATGTPRSAGFAKFIIESPESTLRLDTEPTSHNWPHPMFVTQSQYQPIHVRKLPVGTKVRFDDEHLS